MAAERAHRPPERSRAAAAGSRGGAGTVCGLVRNPCPTIGEQFSPGSEKPCQGQLPKRSGVRRSQSGPMSGTGRLPGQTGSREANVMDGSSENADVDTRQSSAEVDPGADSREVNSDFDPSK